jgi:hypothetical protein
MKTSTQKLSLLAAIFCLGLIGNTRPALAADENTAAPDERLQRLERRLGELADRQEQMLRRLGEQQERMMSRFGGPEGQAPMAAPGREGLRPAGPMAGAPGPARSHHDHPLLGFVLLVFLICNVLLAIWIATDIRRRGEGSGLFIALAVVAGIPAAIIYSLVRIGDRLPVAVKSAP